jgi:hypothetical protein
VLLRKSTIPAGDLIHPDVLAHIGTGGAPATGVVGVWTRRSGSRWRIWLVWIRVRRRSGWVRIGIGCRRVGTRIGIRCRTDIRIVLATRPQIRNYDDRARIRTRRRLGWRIRPRLRANIVVLLPTLDYRVLNRHITGQRIHINSTGHLFDRIGGGKNIDGYWRRCGRRILEALDCGNATTHQGANAH